MSIASRITSMEQHIGNAYDKLDDLGIDLTNVEKNLNNIAELLDGVYEEYPKIEENDVTEPSINNTKAGKMEIDLKGNTEQTTYTGKNLLKPDKNLKPSTMEGITFTPVYEDGILKRIDITGTSTGRAYYYLQSTNQPFGDISGNITVSTTGTASGIHLNQDNFIDNIYKDYQIASGTTKPTYNPSNLGYTQYRNYINIPFTTATTYNTSVYPMFEQGDTATSYEPYTGATASPNPDYPQDVEVVTGENTVKVVNKNLFDNTAERINAIINETVGKPVTYTQSNATYVYKKCCKVKANTTYTISWKQSSTPASSNYRKGTVVDENNIALEALFDTWRQTLQYISITPTTTGYLMLGTDIGTTDIMIEQGSTATTYEEHKEQDFPISLSSKNKADLSTFEIGYVGTMGQIWKQGINNGEKSSQYIEVKPNTTYTFTIVETQSQYDNWFGVGEYSNNDINNFIQRITMTITTQNYFTFTTSNTTKYVRLSARNLEGATKIQFSESSTPATLETYQPYYNYELCKIGDYKDYIYRTTGKNLFSLTNNYSRNGIDYTFNNSTLTINGTSTGEGGFTPMSDTPKIATLPAGTYTLSFNFASGTISGTSNVVIRNLDTSTNIVDSVYGANTTYTFTLSTETNIGFNLYQLGSGRQYSNYVVNIQLERGSSKSNYEPYGSKNTYWYIKKKFNKQVLQGNETNITIYSSNTSRTVFRCPTPRVLPSLSTNLNMKSSHFIAVTQGTTWSYGNFAARSGDDDLYYTIGPNETVESFKTWLSSNNVTSYYVLATEQDILITDTTLISQLNALEKAKSYDDTTNIIQENNDLPFILDIKTLKKS